MRCLILLLCLLVSLPVNSRSFNHSTNKVCDTLKDYWDDCRGKRRGGYDTRYWEEGYYKNNKLDGGGKIRWETGAKYNGWFKDNIPHGIGTYTWPDNSTWTGPWKGWQQHGYGTLTYGSLWEAMKNWDFTKEKKGYWVEGTYVSESRNAFERIYNNCILDKSDGRDMKVHTVRKAAESSCKEIAKDPSWLESFKYD